MKTITDSGATKKVEWMMLVSHVSRLTDSIDCEIFFLTVILTVPKFRMRIASHRLVTSAT
jgi:hypothetical protein